MISRYLSRFLMERSLLTRSALTSQSLLIRRFSSQNDQQTGEQSAQFSEILYSGQRRVFSENVSLMSNRKELLQLLTSEGSYVSPSYLGSGINQLLKIKGYNHDWTGEEKGLAQKLRAIISEHVSNMNFITPLNLRFFAQMMVVLKSDLGIPVPNGEVADLLNLAKVLVDKKASFVRIRGSQDEVSTYFQFTAILQDSTSAAYLLKIFRERENELLSYQQLTRVRVTHIQILRIPQVKSNEIKNNDLKVLIREVQKNIENNLDKYSPTELSSFFKILAQYKQPQLRSFDLVKKIGSHLEQNMEDLDQRDVMKIIEAFAKYGAYSKEGGMKNLIQRIHQLIDLGLQHNASSFNVTFMLMYFKYISQYDFQFKPAKKIVLSCIQFLINKEADIKQTYQLTESLLSVGSFYKIDSPQVEAFIFKKLKSINHLSRPMDKFKNTLTSALRFFTNNNSSYLQELQSYLKNLDTSADFLSLPSCIKLLEISLLLNDKELQAKRMEDLITLISQSSLSETIFPLMEQLIIGSNNAVLNDQIVSHLFAKENLEQEFEDLTFKKKAHALQLYFHGFKPSQTSQKIFQKLQSLVKDLNSETKRIIVTSSYENMAQTANQNTLLFIRQTLEEEGERMHTSMKFNLSQLIYKQIMQGSERQNIREEGLKCIQLCAQQSEPLVYMSSFVQKLYLTSPLLKEKTISELIPQLKEVTSGLSPKQFLQTYKFFGRNLRTAIVNYDEKDQQMFQTFMQSLKIYEETFGLQKGVETSESSSSSSSEEEVKEQQGEFMGYHKEISFLLQNLDIMVVISQLLRKIPSSLSEEEYQSTRLFLNNLFEQIEKVVGQRYSQLRTPREAKRLIVKAIFNLEAQIGSEHSYLKEVLSLQEEKGLLFTPMNWVEIMKQASCTDLFAFSFEFPNVRRGFAQNRRDAVALLIDDYKKMNKNKLDFHFDQNVLNFVTQHRVRDISFFNQFIQRLGDNFAKLNLAKMKKIPVSFMRAGLRQSDIFKSMATKYQTPTYKRNMFANLFHNAVRLQIHKQDWFVEYARDFFENHWKDFKFSQRALVSILEGAYFMLEEQGTQFLHQPISDILETLANVNRLPYSVTSSGHLITLLNDRTNLIPDSLKIKDEDLKNKLLNSSISSAQFNSEFNAPRVRLGRFNVLQKINQVFGLSGEQEVRIAEDTIPGILIPNRQATTHNSKHIILPLYNNDLLIDQATPNHMGELKRKILEHQGYHVILIPQGVVRKAKTQNQFEQYLRNTLSPYFPNKEDSQTEQTEPQQL